MMSECLKPWCSLEATKEFDDKYCCISCWSFCEQYDNNEIQAKAKEIYMRSEGTRIATQEELESVGLGKPINGAKQGSGLRYNTNKPEIHQVPISLINGVAEVLKYGEQKYAKGNWKGGFEWTIPYDCLMRHMFAWLSGEEQDKESGLSHLYHAAANIAMLIEFKETHKELDNREF